MGLHVYEFLSCKRSETQGMLLFTSALLLLAHLSIAQKSSPCPSIFAYEPKGNEDNRWYARVTTTTPDELNGIWLRVQLDQPAELLGVNEMI